MTQIKNALVLIALVLSFSSFANAAEKLCPAGSVEVSQCVADAVIPFYPYVSICQSGTNFSIVVDAGSTTSPEQYNVSRTDSQTEVAFTVTDADTDGLKFTITRCSCDDKVKATLSYKLVGADMNNGYTCKSSIH